MSRRVASRRREGPLSTLCNCRVRLCGTFLTFYEWLLLSSLKRAPPAGYSVTSPTLFLRYTFSLLTAAFVRALVMVEAAPEER